MILMAPIIGDICGSIYEFGREKIKHEPENLMLDGCTFTDDTVHTIAVADAIINNPDNPDFETYIRKYTLAYPNAGYGPRFWKWANGNGDNDSFGNGCCMRIAPILWYYEGYERMAMIAKMVGCSHNHPQSYKYAFMMNSVFDGFTLPSELSDIVSKKQHMLLEDEISLEEYAENYKFDCTCAGSVPEAIYISDVCDNFIDGIKKAISLGGDSDTIACMVGALIGDNPWNNEYKKLEVWAWDRLPERFQVVIKKFEKLCRR